MAAIGLLIVVASALMFITNVPTGLTAADVVVIPVQPSPFDVWAAAETVDLINEARIYKESLKSVIVLNRKIVNTAIGRDVRDVVGTLGLPVMKADVSQRVAFAEAVSTGQTVADIDPDGQAAREIDAFTSELVRTHEQQKGNHGRAADRRVARGG